MRGRSRPTPTQTVQKGAEVQPNRCGTHPEGKDQPEDQTQTSLDSERTQTSIYPKPREKRGHHPQHVTANSQEQKGKRRKGMILTPKKYDDRSTRSEDCQQRKQKENRRAVPPKALGEATPK